MAKKLKSSCCKKYRKKGVACSRCPLVASLEPSDRRAFLKQAKKKRKKKSG
ncbi:MAG: hypothetical protein AAFY88_09975 [Acidobacteriota bacterium]